MATRLSQKRVIKRPARLDEAPTLTSEPVAKKKKVGKTKKKKAVEPAAAVPLPVKRASALRKAGPVKTPEEQEEAQSLLKERIGRARAVKVGVRLVRRCVWLREPAARERQLDQLLEPLAQLSDASPARARARRPSTP